MKGIPIKRNTKTIIFLLTRGAWSSPYVILAPPHFTPPPLCPPTPLHPGLFCNMQHTCGPRVLYALTARCGLHFAAAPERTAHALHCLLSLLLAATHGLSDRWPLSFYIFPLLSCCCSLGVRLQFQFGRVCAAMKYSCPKTKRFTINKRHGTWPIWRSSLVKTNEKRTSNYCRQSGLHSYRPAFSFVVVTWYFTRRSFVFTETTRLYSSVFMGFHRSFCQMCFCFHFWCSCSFSQSVGRLHNWVEHNISMHHVFSICLSVGTQGIGVKASPLGRK